MRGGLSFDSAYNAAKIIYKAKDLDAVAITDTRLILTHVGLGYEHHKTGMLIMTFATKNTTQTGVINIANTKKALVVLLNLPIK